MNKKFSIVAVLSVLALVGAGCSSTTSTNNNGAMTDTGSTSASTASQVTLDGTWKVTSATGDMASLNEGTKYIFSGDSLTTKLGIIETKGTITAKDDSSLTVKFEGMSSESHYNYHFDGSKLVIEPQGSGQVLTLEKQ